MSQTYFLEINLQWLIQGILTDTTKHLSKQYNGMQYRQGSIKASEFDSYLDYTQPNGENLVQDKELAVRLEVSHYILNWLFDMM